MDENNPHCQKLIDYFARNKTYEIKEEFYRTEVGFKVRSEWGQFCNKSGLLNVKIDGKYEVAATVPNLIAFFMGFFPKLKLDPSIIKEFNYENVISKELFKSYETALNQIYAQLSPKPKI